MATAEAGYAGSTGARYKLRMDYYEQNVNTGANTSEVVSNLYMYTSDEYGWTNGTSPGCNMSIDGTGYSGSGNYGALGSHASGVKAMLISSQVKTVGHDANGTKTVNLTGSHNAGQGAGLGSASLNFNFTLTTINRYAAINSYTHSLVTDSSLRLNVSTDVTCDLLEYSINGAGYVSVGGDFTSKTVDLTNLLSDTAYSIVVRVRRKDSGLTTTSGAVASTTAKQNNFFGTFLR
jgi:hypothetical protein